MVRIGIIGTAGRKEDANRMSKELYDKMKILIYRMIIYIEPDFSKIQLVSGGAAWSDHLAVSLYLEHSEINLSLHLPCQFDEGKYINSKTGNIGNYYHGKFSDKVGYNTLKEIGLCIQKGANIKVGDGFYDRNNSISQSVDYLIAFTWGTEGKPKDGGTSNTWKSCPPSVKKIHISLELFS